MHADDAGDPSHRGVGSRQLDRDIDELPELDLSPTPSRRLQCSEESAVDQQLPRRVGHAAKFVALGGESGELGCDVASGVEQGHDATPLTVEGVNGARICGKSGSSGSLWPHRLCESYSPISHVSSSTRRPPVPYSISNPEGVRT